MGAFHSNQKYRAVNVVSQKASKPPQSCKARDVRPWPFSFKKIIYKKKPEPRIRLHSECDCVGTYLRGAHGLRVPPSAALVGLLVK